ncbi:hypothetical protein G6F42_021587 [Rhizopus arrhizus]|nr:hypothetical protein G6F42_021587 [Rhizopus arrhizus]
MKLAHLSILIVSTALLLINTSIAALTATTVSGAKAGVLKSHSKRVLTGYFPNYLYETFLPSEIDFSAYTHINYAFALVNNGSTLIWDDSGVFNGIYRERKKSSMYMFELAANLHLISYTASVDYSFQNLVKLAHEAGTKVMISCGGWTGRLNYSSMVASPTSRQEFIQWNIDYISKHNLAGVDLDWEYPNDPGPGCNQYSPEDASNFLLLIKELREALDETFPNKHKEITLAVSVVPWGPGQEVQDVSGFVPYVDRFQVMVFELNSATDPLSGPNAPFMTETGKGL